MLRESLVETEAIASQKIGVLFPDATEDLNDFRSTHAQKIRFKELLHLCMVLRV